MFECHQQVLAARTCVTVFAGPALVTTALVSAVDQVAVAMVTHVVYALVNRCTSPEINTKKSEISAVNCEYECITAVKSHCI